MEDPSQKKGDIPVINEPEKDSFTLYKKDPRKLPHSKKVKTTNSPSPMLKKLNAHISSCKEEEDFYDQLRYFKKNELLSIEKLESSPLINRQKIVNSLSAVATAIVKVGHEYMSKAMTSQYGLPSYLNSFKQTESAELAIVGMGKIGAHEINYYSDLDVIFIYSHIGETLGNVSITNNEYYGKLAQKIINILAITTRAGICYDIDTELRPSGNTGTLVSSYDHFIDHQMNRAQNWDRQALIRAQCISAEEGFASLLNNQLNKLAYERPLAKDFRQNMHQIRQQVIRERAKTGEGIFDIKLGKGALMDIEFTLHLIQLENSHLFND